MKRLKDNRHHKIKLVVAMLLLMTMIACGILSGEKPPVDTPSIKPLQSPPVVDDQNWVIFTKEYAEEMGIGSWLVGNGDFWTPSVEDISLLEEKLLKYLMQNSSQFYRQPPVWERLDQYQRQYFGLEHGGEQIIYGNYFCNNIGKDWRQEVVIVEDGGDCYFQVEYDVESGIFIQLWVNGES